MGNLPRVARVEVLDASDAAAIICGGTPVKNPDGFAGRVVLAGINVDDPLFVPSSPFSRRQPRLPFSKSIHSVSFPSSAVS